MSSETESQKKESDDEEFTGSLKKQKKSVSKNKGKSKEKEKEKQKQKKGKAAKKPKEKQKKQGKDVKQVKKKKPSVSKQKVMNNEKDMQAVRQYLQKQNRPYSLINVFDNLHGSIKKPALQVILDSLTQKGHLTCKQFGKNKVYFLNQSKFQITQQQIQKVANQLANSRQQNTELQTEHKNLSQQYRKLMSLRTDEQMKEQIMVLSSQIKALQAKRQRLMTNNGQNKIDEKIVVKAQKAQQKMRKQLKKLKMITKDSLKSWAQILGKKPIQVAQIMGLDV